MRLDTAHAMAAVSESIKNKKPKDRVFGISNSVYLKWWNWAAARCSCRLPPHPARHLGAARDAATGYRTIEQIQRRGRWKAIASVRRYAKTSAFIAVQEEQPENIKNRGRELLAQRIPRPAQPRE